MTHDQLSYNNERKLDVLKKIATRVADSLVSNNQNVTDTLDKNNIEFIVNSSIKSTVEKELK